MGRSPSPTEFSETESESESPERKRRRVEKTEPYKPRITNYPELVLLCQPALRDEVPMPFPSYFTARDRIEGVLWMLDEQADIQLIDRPKLALLAGLSSLLEDDEKGEPKRSISKFISTTLVEVKRNADDNPRRIWVERVRDKFLVETSELNKAKEQKAKEKAAKEQEEKRAKEKAAKEQEEKRAKEKAAKEQKEKEKEAVKKAAKEQKEKEKEAVKKAAQSSAKQNKIHIAREPPMTFNERISQSTEFEESFVMRGALTGIKESRSVPLEEAVASLPVNGIVQQAALAVRNARTNILVQQLHKENNVPLEALASITLYTSQSTFGNSYYEKLNESLRAEDRNKARPYFPSLRWLLIALERLPRYQGNVYRAVAGDVGYKDGTQIIFWGFTSTSTCSEVANNFSGNDLCSIFMIKCIHGVKIDKLSAFPRESEVLIPPGYEFRVEHSFRVPNGKHILYNLTQLEACYVN